MTEALIYAGILVVGAVLTWKGSRILSRSANRLSARYELPLLVQGTLVVAVGSSFPELVTTVGSTLVHGDFELGMATIVGSAVFNILVIPGLAALVGEDLGHDIRLVYRDALFYLTSVAVLLLAFSFALIYQPVEGPGLQGTLTRPLALVPILLYGLYLFLQHQETVEMGREGADSLEPPEDAREPRREAAGDGSALRDWALLAGGIVLVVLGVEGLLRTALWLGEALDTPSFLWGATVIAAVTSVPDALVSVREARRGAANVSLGNVLGSNIFDLLVAIPVGVLVAGASTVDFAVAAPLMAYLTLATVVLFAAMRTRLTLNRAEAWWLLALYGIFLAWLGLETAGVTGWIG